jgi:hypothetical protein
MPRFVRIGNEVIHIPSLANVSMGTTCLGAPFLCFYYHNQKNQTMSYGFGKWAACEADLIRVKTAMIEIEKVVGAIPLTEEKESRVFPPVLEDAHGKTLVPVTPLAGKGAEA